MKPVLKVEPMKTLFPAKAALSALAFGLAMTIAPSASATNAKVGPTVAPDTLEVAGMEGVKPDTRPVPVIAPKPDYPRWALAIEREGWVVVEVDIDENGMPHNAEIIESGQSELFDKPTLKAMKKFRFEPATLNGKAVPVTGQRYKVVYAFQNS